MTWTATKRYAKSSLETIRHLLLWIFFGWTFTVTDIAILYAGNHLLPRTMEWPIKMALVILGLILADKFGVAGLQALRFKKLSRKFADRISR
jgi:hypothetical protein